LNFKAYVKQQKTLSSDIIRTTDRKLKSVTDEIQRLNFSVQETSNDVDNNKLSIKQLRSDTSKVIQPCDADVTCVPVQPSASACVLWC